jgi:hypothetical protein
LPFTSISLDYRFNSGHLISIVTWSFFFLFQKVDIKQRFGDEVTDSYVNYIIDLWLLDHRGNPAFNVESLLS